MVKVGQSSRGLRGPARNFVFASALALSLTWHLFGQQNPPPDDTLTFRSATNLVLLDVIAFVAGTDTPAQNLKQSDFQVFDDGHLVSLRTFDRGLESRPIVLWFLTQCNMQGWEKRGSGLFAGRAREFAPALEHLGKNDMVAVAHWCDDGQSQVDLMPSRDRQQAAPTLERVLVSVPSTESHARPGELALQQTLKRITDTTAQLPGQPIPVIVFLYGDWSGMPKAEADRFVNGLLATSAIVFGIRDTESPQMRELSWLGGEQPSVANYLAEQTGGRYFKVSADQYGTALERILDELHSRYELGF